MYFECQKFILTQRYVCVASLVCVASYWDKRKKYFFFIFFFINYCTWILVMDTLITFNLNMIKTSRNPIDKNAIFNIKILMMHTLKCALRLNQQEKMAKNAIFLVFILFLMIFISKSTLKINQNSFLIKRNIFIFNISCFRFGFYWFFSCSNWMRLT